MFIEKSLIIAFLNLALFHANAQQSIEYGADANPSGLPIGGGAGYTDLIDPNEYEGNIYRVRNASELLVALANARSEEIVYVESGSIIDLSGEANIVIKGDVTLAGDRGDQGSPGPLIMTNSLPLKQYLFRVEDGVRITGLRIRGPDVDFDEITYSLSPFVEGAESQSDSKCIGVFGTDVEIDNCEISNFHRVGIDVQRGTTRLSIHHNYLHNIHAYPILVVSRTSMPIIVEANIIEWIWHAIAGTGAPGTGYEARYNRFITRPIPHSWYSEGSHCIDMHPDNDIRDDRGDLVAADFIHVHHNTFIDSSDVHPRIRNLEDAKIRGVPRILARFHHNIFHNEEPSDAVSYNGDPGNLWVHDNLYGQQKKLLEIAKPTTPKIVLKSLPLPDRKIPTIKADSIKLEFDAIPLSPLTITNVEILLNHERIYEGTNTPNHFYLHGNLLLDTLPYQELIIRATDSNEGTATYKTVFDLEPRNGGTSLHPLEVIYQGKVARREFVKMTLKYGVTLPANFHVENGAKFEISRETHKRK